MPSRNIWFAFAGVLIAGILIFAIWLVVDHNHQAAGHDSGMESPISAPPADATVPQPNATPVNTPPTPAASQGNSPTPEQQPGGLPVVCIDPGHPSEVNTATTVQHGLKEVEVVYDVAQKLRAILEEQKIAQVVMTRNFRSYTGKIVSNKERAEIANAHGAILFLRLHCDTGNGEGFTLYYPDRPARKGNVTGPPAAVCQASAKAADALHQGMVDTLCSNNPGITIRDNGVKPDSATFVGGKQGALTGSIYSQVPTVTVEMVYLSNAADAKLIGSDDGKNLFAEALSYGITNYLSELKK
ncbi:MAG TPA: N-acetylmuramoyl-L-alanine amidase [Armatimonadota bacterium]|nr:N-acetylmuramoyl-L-alanine amidase [Armatimonadota bacterium]